MSKNSRRVLCTVLSVAWTVYGGWSLCAKTGLAAVIARHVLIEQSMAVAGTTYQVRPTEDSPQLKMFVAAGISANLGALIALIGGVSLLMGRRKA